jgi:hypothetical protein
VVFPRGTPFTLQATASPLVFVTVAVNACVLPRITVPLAGVTLMEMDGGGAGEGVTKPAPPPPQPSVHAPAVRSPAKKQILRIRRASIYAAILAAWKVVSSQAAEKYFPIACSGRGLILCASAVEGPAKLKEGLSGHQGETIRLLNQQFVQTQRVIRFA